MNSKRCIITEILKTSKKHIQKLLTKQVLILMPLGGGGGGGGGGKTNGFYIINAACLLASHSSLLDNIAIVENKAWACKA